MERRQIILNGFFYLAPVWFLVETFLWPGFRAGVVTGGSTLGNVLFYSVEAGLGAAIWFRLPYADISALVENAVYLLFVMKFILFTPLDIAMNIGDNTEQAAAMAVNYKAAMPGIIYSMAHVGFKIQKTIGCPR